MEELVDPLVVKKLRTDIALLQRVVAADRSVSEMDAAVNGGSVVEAASVEELLLVRVQRTEVKLTHGDGT